MPRGPNIWLGKQRGDVVLTKRDGELVALALENEELLSVDELAAFVSMGEQLKLGNRALSEKQRAWLEMVLTKLDICLPAHPPLTPAQKKIPEEKPQGVPAVMKRLPLKPPTRALTDDDWRDQ